MLVNVDNATLSRLINNKQAYEAVMKIEGLNLEIIFSKLLLIKSEALKRQKKKCLKEENVSKEDKKTLSDEEKEEKSKRKQVQEKLIKFATRIPIFMYLTDYREHSLRDVITQLEPNLFKKVTGLTIPDFELLVSIGLFNENLMNDAVFKFRRYEDDLLSYRYKQTRRAKKIGLYNTSITRKEFVEPPRNILKRLI